jgi:hypothetical protein
MQSRWAFLRSALLVSTLVASCGSSRGVATESPADGAGAAALDGSSAIDARADAGERDTAADARAQTEAGGSCSAERPCSVGQFCELPLSQAGLCGAPGVPGTCQNKPATCVLGGAPVCGCDGQTYPNDCLRQKAGVPLAFRSACQGWETGTIRCGASTCAPNQVCVYPASLCGAPPPCMPAGDGGACPTGTVACMYPGTQTKGCSASCQPAPPYCLDIPASCRTLPTCACLQPTQCACGGIDGGRTVVCQGAP